MGKGENASCLHFLILLQCFQKASFTEFLKLGILFVLNSEILITMKFKGVADEKLNVAHVKRSIPERRGNTVGEVENAGYQMSLGLQILHIKVKNTIFHVL